ncbi:MAG: hypothetical protein IPJ56_18895 [Gemmatimonadetes bacterium]|jgi:hypothetical protein|nr:hypothetical protein [Gemmatimonadota bacterium]
MWFERPYFGEDARDRVALDEQPAQHALQQTADLLVARCARSIAFGRC